MTQAIRDEVIEELLQGYRSPEDLLGEEGLFRELKKRLLARALGAELTLDKFKTQVRDMTRRTRGISLPQLIEQLTPYLIGWRGYFGFCQTPRVLTNLEAWIRRRLRSYLWRQWQNGPNRFNCISSHLI